MYKKSDVCIDFIDFVEYGESIAYPMGLLCLSAYLKKCGFSNIVYIPHICMLRKMKEKEGLWDRSYLPEMRENNIKRLLEHLKERDPHLILLGPITSMYVVELVDLVGRLRKQCPEAVILAGGPHFGKEPRLDEELLQKYCRELDGVVVGEAEETVAELVDAFYSQFREDRMVLSHAEFLAKLAEVPGIRSQDGTFRSRSPPSLKDMPPPDMGLLEDYWKNPKIPEYYEYKLSERRNPEIGIDEGYFQGDSDWGNTEDPIHRFDQYSGYSRFPFGIIVGSRGCPYKCSFCCSPGHRRVHSARYVFDQMIDLNKRFSTRLFVFFDPLFTTASQMEQRRVEELCQMLLDSDLNFSYMIEIRADIILKLPEELLAKIVRSGCAEFNLGIEKGSDKNLEKMVKRTKIEDHFAAVAKLRRIAKETGKDILVNGTFILGGPGETKKDVKETLIHSYSLNLDEATVYPLEVQVGTHIYKEALSEGILKRGLSPYLDAEKYPLFATKNLPREYLHFIEKLNKSVIRDLRDFTNEILKIERQFLPEEQRDFFNLERRRTEQLYNHSRKFIERALSYLKQNPNGGLWINGRVTVPFQTYIENVNTEIHRLEEQLQRQYLEHEHVTGDYYPGTLSSKWQSFVKSFAELFTSENYDGRWLIRRRQQPPHFAGN
ncbi:MAG TPA: radical SAM protein [Candidatus Hodarchaeales archaeon]|nr:radical SAM protein [Candidatus Hodarchaeales archaeon]